ncbi:methylated-DNA--[protein]-cysteine S-methyltransferase [Nodosilinea sp. FACHB-131]|uniref:methylated-DNA--[protein]-cysteine S-methyltransferase n=1 Tax=Cyanophyceae TaxID=3028117 RepID=UPI001687EACD|nr:methylated-DNA--[protein]-cysteine S-methyltransferase [Nodosilinea sp. FACHB-131]MBD1876108.1 methylated-DNA--[protein]-cysteine S-methyltransferase [Nodosilinea sp. FACHB-131]
MHNPIELAKPPVTTELWIDTLPSAIGDILLVSDGASLCALDFADYETRLLTLLHKRFTAVTLTPCANPQGFSDRLRAYLAGDLHSFDSVPVNPGGTAFQQQVWLALRQIPAGTVATYGELAAKLGKPTAYRAVGMANSLNPVAIALPCHRVVGTNGQLTGYAGGLERKQWLLHHEGADLANRGAIQQELALEL